MVPIIEQDVARVSQEHTAEQLTRLRAEIERTVLSRAAGFARTDWPRHGNITVIL